MQLFFSDCLALYSGFISYFHNDANLIIHLRRGKSSLNSKAPKTISNESWLMGKFRAVKSFMEKCYCGDLFWEDLTFYLVNTEKGKAAYFKETGTQPDLLPSQKWDSEHGKLETRNGLYFIFVDTTLIENRMELEVQLTLKHEIVRALHPYCLKKEILQIEEALEGLNDPALIMGLLPSCEVTDFQSMSVKTQAKKRC